MKKVYMLIFILICISCGTETGNPLLPQSNSGGGDTVSDSPVGITSHVLSIVNEVCEKLEECFPTELSGKNCNTVILNEDGFDGALGLQTTLYDDLSEIISDESSDVISADSTISTQCRNDIKALSCSDSEVINSYNTSAQNDFSNTYLMLPQVAGSCSNLFD